MGGPHFLHIVLVFTMASVCACAGLQRHPRSGYYDPAFEATESQDIYSERERLSRERGLEELGLTDVQELSEEDQQRLMDRVELNRLERRLDAVRDKKQYYSHKPYFENDRERIYFLSLGDFEARERYLRSKGIGPGSEVYPDHIADLIEKSDVAVGMSRKAVQESWGDPDVVEVAGDPIYGNERWKYARMVSSSGGFNKEIRVIYFESGRVVGWERQ